MAKLVDQIAKVKQSLVGNPVSDEPAAPRGVRKVAKAKKVEVEEEDEAPKKGKGPKKVTKVAKKEEKSAKKNGNGNGKAPRNQEVPEGHVSVSMLASEAGITAQSARVKLRASEMERPEGRWVFADGSKLLKKAREVLGITE